MSTNTQDYTQSELAVLGLINSEDPVTYIASHLSHAGKWHVFPHKPGEKLPQEVQLALLTGNPGSVPQVLAEIIHNAEDANMLSLAEKYGINNLEDASKALEDCEDAKECKEINVLVKSSGNGNQAITVVDSGIGMTGTDISENLLKLWDSSKRKLGLPQKGKFNHGMKAPLLISEKKALTIGTRHQNGGPIFVSALAILERDGIRQLLYFGDSSGGILEVDYRRPIQCSEDLYWDSGTIVGMPGMPYQNSIDDLVTELDSEILDPLTSIIVTNDDGYQGLVKGLDRRNEFKYEYVSKPRLIDVDGEKCELIIDVAKDGLVTKGSIICHRLGAKLGIIQDVVRGLALDHIAPKIRITLDLEKLTDDQLYAVFDSTRSYARETALVLNIREQVRTILKDDQILKELEENEARSIQGESGPLTPKQSIVKAFDKIGIVLEKPAGGIGEDVTSPGRRTTTKTDLNESPEGSYIKPSKDKKTSDHARYLIAGGEHRNAGARIEYTTDYNQSKLDNLHRETEVLLCNESTGTQNILKPEAHFWKRKKNHESATLTIKSSVFKGPVGTKWAVYITYIGKLDPLIKINDIAYLEKVNPVPSKPILNKRSLTPEVTLIGEDEATIVGFSPHAHIVLKESPDKVRAYVRENHTQLIKAISDKLVTKAEYYKEAEIAATAIWAVYQFGNVKADLLNFSLESSEIWGSTFLASKAVLMEVGG